MGGVGRSQTFANHNFYGIFDPFLPKISGKFTVEVPIVGFFLRLPLLNISASLEQDKSIW